MEDYIARLRTLFGGLERAHGEYRVDKDNLDQDKLKVGGQAKTVATPVTDELWEKHLRGQQGLGVIPIRDDGTVVWACLDIDAYGKDICKSVTEFFREYNLPFVVCRSKSGGAHVFIFFKVPMKAKPVMDKLAKIAKSMGHEGCEVFPKQYTLDPDQYGNWLNMPYFNHEYANDRVAYDIDYRQLSLEKFLDYAENLRVDEKTFRQLEVPTLEHPFSDGPPCLQALDRDKSFDGRRNESLMQFAVYFKEKYGEEQYADRLIQYDSTGLPDPLGYREINDTILKSTDRKDYGYKCPHLGKQTFADVCNLEQCRGRRYGVGGAGQQDFDTNIQLGDMKRLIYFMPDETPLDDDPDWDLTVNGRPLRFKTEELMNQQQFQRKLFKKLKLYPPGLPVARWRAIMQDKLDESEDVEVPFETSPMAQTLGQVILYLSQNGHDTSMNSLWDNLVYCMEGEYRFRIEGLFKWITEHQNRPANQKLIYEHLDLFGFQRRDSTTRDENGHTRRITFYSITEGQLEQFGMVPQASNFDQEEDDRVEF